MTLRGNDDFIVDLRSIPPTDCSQDNSLMANSKDNSKKKTFDGDWRVALSEKVLFQINPMLTNGVNSHALFGWKNLAPIRRIHYYRTIDH